MTRRIVVAAVICFLVLYGVDDALVRFRIPKGREPFGTVMVRRYYAIQQKANRVEYVFDKEENQRCVRALFPHLGYVPCWYLSRHPEQRVDI